MLVGAVVGSVGDGKTEVLKHLIPVLNENKKKSEKNYIALDSEFKHIAYYEQFQDNIFLPKFLKPELKECCHNSENFIDKIEENGCLQYLGDECDIENCGVCGLIKKMENNYCVTCGRPLNHKSCKLTFSGIVQILMLIIRGGQVSRIIDEKCYGWMERLSYDDFFTFARMSYKRGEMPYEWFKAYCMAYRFLMQLMNRAGFQKPKVMIFVETDIEIKIQRLVKAEQEKGFRNAGLNENWYLTEEGKSYLLEISKYYQDFKRHVQKSKEWKGVKVITVNNSGTIEESINYIIEELKEIKYA